MASSYVASSYEVLIVGRFVAGLNAGITSAIAPMYMTEISPLKIRGVFGGLYECFHVFGILLSEIIGLPFLLGKAGLWPVLFGLAVIPSLFQLFTFPFCPESPKYLLMDKDKPGEAKKELERLRGSVRYDQEWEVMLQEKEDLHHRKELPIRKFLKNKFLMRVALIAGVVTSSSQLCGHDTVIYYSTGIFRSGGLTGDSAEYATVGVGGVLLVSTIAATLFVDHVGRRILLLFGLGAMCVLTAMLTVFLALFEKAHPNGCESGTVGAGYEWTPYATMVVIFLLLVTFAIGPGTIPPFITDELFTDDARPAASSLALAILWISELILVGTFPIIQSVIGAYTFVIYAVLLVFYFAFTFFQLPETKGREIEEVVEELKQKYGKRAGSRDS
ncbi:solute carrier family 2, facilitated glucose transporter member 1-like [Paramacrobiotus metropolitanus]|uniref:solute carrier family 2, facilitated glucose transporter member 1-like n=1 Tax=Paramacrobiotus metropolitanus TaxID=2943436 RepID=UPI0024464CC4|nr:solute carrier family 2, facilitated glucose transporter member 1-like [Paramacrobiotus metropolitanus]